MTLITEDECIASNSKVLSNVKHSNNIEVKCLDKSQVDGIDPVFELNFENLSLIHSFDVTL